MLILLNYPIIHHWRDDVNVILHFIACACLCHTLTILNLCSRHSSENYWKEHNIISLQQLLNHENESSRSSLNRHSFFSGQLCNLLHRWGQFCFKYFAVSSIIFSFCRRCCYLRCHSPPSPARPHILSPSLSLSPGKEKNLFDLNFLRKSKGMSPHARAHANARSCGVHHSSFICGIFFATGFSR